MVSIRVFVYAPAKDGGAVGSLGLSPSVLQNFNVTA